MINRGSSVYIVEKIDKKSCELFIWQNRQNKLKISTVNKRQYYARKGRRCIPKSKNHTLVD